MKPFLWRPQGTGERKHPATLLNPPRLSSVCLHFQGKGDYQGRVLYFLPLLTLPLQLKPITQENNSVGNVISPVLSVKTWSEKRGERRLKWRVRVLVAGQRRENKEHMPAMYAYTRSSCACFVRVQVYLLKPTKHPTTTRTAEPNTLHTL